LAGGLLGSGLRATIGELFPAAPGTFPAATLLVNLAGSLVLGFYLARRQRAITSGWSLRFWAIGGLGSFTTFSTFSAEVFRLVEAGAPIPAVWYVLASLIGGVAAALLGERLGSVGR
jgi:CrcB protein